MVEIVNLLILWKGSLPVREVDGLGEMENEEEDGRTETGGTETEEMEAGGTGTEAGRTEADGREADGMAASREEVEESKN